MDARAGETILVTGATGSVGRVAVFVAKARGAKVYAGVRGNQREEAEKLGVAGVVAIDDDADIGALPASMASPTPWTGRRSRRCSAK